MPIVDCKIMIPEGYRLKEPLPRYLHHGEMGIKPGYFPVINTGQTIMEEYYILEKGWEWPEWLNAEWIIQTKELDWYAFEQEPYILYDGYWYTSGNRLRLDSRLIKFNPPPCTDWRQSKRRNPHILEKQ